MFKWWNPAQDSLSLELVTQLSKRKQMSDDHKNIKVVYQKNRETVDQ